MIDGNTQKNKNKTEEEEEKKLYQHKHWVQKFPQHYYNKTAKIEFYFRKEKGKEKGKRTEIL